MIEEPQFMGPVERYAWDIARARAKLMQVMYDRKLQGEQRVEFLTSAREGFNAIRRDLDKNSLLTEPEKQGLRGQINRHVTELENYVHPERNN